MAACPATFAAVTSDATLNPTSAAVNVYWVPVAPAIAEHAQVIPSHRSQACVKLIGSVPDHVPLVVVSV